MSYSLVSPECFTEQHQQYLSRFRRSIEAVSARSNACVGAKDIQSRHLIATDSYARIVGLAKGGDVAERFDRDMPCEGTAQFADCFVREDQSLLAHSEPNRMTSVLNVHQYSNGLKALIFDKFVLKHRPSRSILGTIYSAREIELSRFFTTLPTYTFEFGIGCSIESTGPDAITGDVALTEVEHEVAFLLTMNWNAEQIAQFMGAQGVALGSSIVQMTRIIAAKLGDESIGAASLREKLIALHVHQKMPSALFRHLMVDAVAMNTSSNAPHG